MIKSSIEKLAEEIGFDIGMSNDETQAKLLNGFCRALKNSMQPNNLNTQICYMVDRLDINSMNIIKEIYEFVKLKDSDK